jgi:hypothetical protein
MRGGLGAASPRSLAAACVQVRRTCLMLHMAAGGRCSLAAPDIAGGACDEHALTVTASCASLAQPEPLWVLANWRPC